MPQSPFYGSAKWRKTREEYIRSNKWCKVCRDIGLFTPVAEVDHIIALSKGGAPFDHKNLRGLCKSHHAQKTVYTEGWHKEHTVPLVTTGADGWPVSVEQPRSVKIGPKKF